MSLHQSYPKCEDFELLCAHAETTGWIVGLTVTDHVTDLRRELEAVHLRRKKTKPRFAFATKGDLAHASRRALTMLKGQPQ